jgi:hypothetical protein
LACFRPSIGGILTLLLCWLGIACKGEVAESGARPGEGFHRGDGVVVESSAATFFEGRVLAASADALRVQTLPAGDVTTVAPGDAYSLVGRHAPAASGYAICRSSRTVWVPCRVDRVEAERTAAVAADGHPLALEPHDVLAPNAVTLLNVKQLFERTRRRTEFTRAALAAGGPRAPPGWVPEPNEMVVVHHESAWYTARASGLADGGLSVALPGATTTEAVRGDRVVPSPPYDHSFERGDFALRAPSVPAEAWRIVRVEAVEAGSVDVVADDDHRARVRSRDLIPLSQR